MPLESCTKSGREDVGADDDLRDNNNQPHLIADASRKTEFDKAQH